MDIMKAKSGLIDVNAGNMEDDGWTALHYAAHEGFENIVELLIRKFDANVNV